MFSEWCKRSKLWADMMPRPYSVGYLFRFEAYELARAAFKAGVRAGIKQERDRKNK